MEELLLNKIIYWSLNNRLFVLAFSALIVVYGALTLSQLPIDVFPDLTKPTITVMTEGHGRAPEEVETLITLPLEYALKGLPQLERVRSVTGVGLSLIYLEFEWGSDLYKSRQLVAEKLQLAKERLPKDVQPTLTPIASLMGQIQQIAISSSDGSVSPLDLRTFAEWNLRPRLMSIPGVAQVISIGGGLKQYQILISAEKLNLYQITLDQLSESLSKISQNTTGGFLDKGSKEYLVRNIGAVKNLSDIEETVIGLHFGKPVQVKDIATVVEDAKIKRGDGSYMGQPAVIMVVQKQPGSDTVSITKEVDRVIQEMAKDIPKSIIINPNVFKQSSFIDASISGIISKLKKGTVLVFIVLLIFLANLRMSLITLTAIPLSFFITFIIFKFFGMSVNTMTLGGLAIAIGELVDDSIVDVENIRRRILENLKSLNPKHILQVVFDASSEVRNSIVLATVIIALVFLPLLNLSGIEGRLFTPLAIAYLTALLASLLVSLTVTPVLSSFLLGQLGKNKNASSEHDTQFVILLKKWDRRILEKIIVHPKTVISFVMVLLVLSLSLTPFMGRDFLPQFNEGTAMISAYSPPGVSLAESNRIGLLVENKILEVPEVKSVSRRTGRAEQDEHASGVNVSEIDVDFKSDIKRSREVILNDIRDRASMIPGIAINVGQPLSHLIDHTLSGVSAQIAIKIFGDDLAILRSKAQQLKKTIESVPGLVDLRVEQQGLIPQLKVYVLRDEASKYGLSPGEITSLAEAAFNGEVVTQVIEDQKFFDLFYRFDDQSRISPEKMSNTIVKTMPDGRKIRFGEVADIYESQGPNEISRENGQRRILISANVSKRDLNSVINEIQTKVSQQIKWDKGYYVIYGGQFEAQKEASRKILIFGLLAVLGIALILFTHFQSKMITAQIMLTIPFAFIGGIILLFITEKNITVASLVGFITLCGIASRNGIMMISHYLHLLKFEGESFNKEMIIRGSIERLVPVLMTAIVASLALLPLVFAKGQPGSEILHPVAVVIVGGLLSSTLLDVFVTPTLFYHFGKKAAESSLKEKTNHIHIGENHD